jgi:hypothetical protein
VQDGDLAALLELDAEMRARDIRIRRAHRPRSIFLGCWARRRHFRSCSATWPRRSDRTCRSTK